MDKLNVSLDSDYYAPCVDECIDGLIKLIEEIEQ